MTGCTVQVSKLQGKWILQTLLRIFATQTPSYEVAVTALRTFVPPTMTSSDIRKAVLSPDIANALAIWQVLAHAGAGSNMSELADILADASEELTKASLQSFHRPVTRLSNMTHFKRLLKDCHQLIVNHKLDAEADANAQSVSSLSQQVQAKIVDMKFNEGDDGFPDFGEVIAALKDNSFFLNWSGFGFGAWGVLIFLGQDS